ncbi:hypothetical protein TNIN_203541 [Trichonephila inaurata madagascariensis]|uniref:Uncharacterized protein n=1 Tax=Trichonephila inaurata madagascariensis TaxID=2747483 RepID=A0A8X6WT72_9ARAC|nr:hypothetical protein TNIN_203541 [Trichonephila inaurata madagascariensis]
MRTVVNSNFEVKNQGSRQSLVSARSAEVKLPAIIPTYILVCNWSDKPFAIRSEIGADNWCKYPSGQNSFLRQSSYSVGVSDQPPYPGELDSVPCAKP